MFWRFEIWLCLVSERTLQELSHDPTRWQAARGGATRPL